MSLENDFFWNTTQQVGRPWRGRLCSFFIELDAGAKQHGVDVLHQRQRQRGKNREKIVRPASRTTIAVHSTPPVVRWGGQENPSSIGIRRLLSGVLVSSCSPGRGRSPCCGFRWNSGLDFRGWKQRGSMGKMIDGLPNSTPTLMKLRTETNPLNDSFPLLERKKYFFKGSAIPTSEI